jgi:diguanylate cyclase (GGDEF)-like protein
MEQRHSTTPHVPVEVRNQLASLLEIDEWQLDAIPIPVLNRLRDVVAVDELTGVLSRRAGLFALTGLIERLRRSADPRLAIVFLDVDGLKSINDIQGHLAGDAAIRAVACAVKRRVRNEDIVFRYGGDEFVCALPHVRPESAVEMLLDAWRRLHRQSGPCFSAGFAELRPDDDERRLITRAEECLCAGRGRDRHRISGLAS